MKKLMLALVFSVISWCSFTAHAEALPPISDYTAEMEAHTGFFTFYHQQDTGHYYLKIPRNEQQFIFQTSLPWGLGSNDIGLDRGQLGSTRLASFTVQGNKALLVHHNTYFRASSSNAAERASIDEAFADSVIAGFTVVAADEQAVIIDYTPFLLSDTHGVVERLAQTQQGSYKVAADRSVIYPARSKAFQDNTELEAKVTFSGQGKGAYVRQVAPDADHLTLHLHHSFIRLPDDSYATREFHPQSGFWAEEHRDYAAPLGESMAVKYIPRHRLAKGETITYYLDPGVPEPVRSALLEGARWWQDAFAAAGHPNGYEVKELPAGADPMDIRYNVIQWVHRATRGWSYGSSVIDPRTGEILKGHVTLGSLRVRQDMLIAQSLLAPYAENLSEEQQQALIADIEAMALARIRQLSAHEVGHTLGIAHNFAASADDRASVMDYPHPLISIATDTGNLTLANAYAEGIGLWDKQVIRYGYGEGGRQLARIIAENKELGLSFISDPDARPVGGAHPDAHLWDNGSDAVAELERVLAVRQTALQQFGLANLKSGMPVSDLRAILVPAYLLHRYQTEAAVKMIAGEHYRYAVKGDAEVIRRPVNAAQQQRALKVLAQTFSAEQLALPASVREVLLPFAYGSGSTRENFAGNTGLIPDPETMAASAARFSLQLLLHPERLERLAQQHQHNPELPDVAAVFATITRTAITPARSGVATTLAERVAFEALTAVAELYQRPLSPVLKGRVLHFIESEQRAWQAASDSAARSLALTAIKQLMDDGTWPLKGAPALPPGSPI
ncbi:zinc-dependent metalloprotease [Pseudidiomarina sp. 1APP75-27a]|uniref:zinc-dependent metalloprotease n=1 Tax=Pseudidiomarina terrestris TaxID=2820060 RepID=UPI002B058CE0|nr:zinc-dependent metalloprotease [Pseudidiomarina sp. 1APP75-27a]MEA3587496.1 zinc-dependent metalloprotease [Pseudidiomarina sp. 1APP75-27a]